MKKELNKIIKFNRITGVVSDSNLNKERRDVQLSINLLKEELEELQEAFNKKNKVEILDACIDIFYVLGGLLFKLNLIDSFIKNFEVVHNSNMSKFCYTIEQVRQSMIKYKSLLIDTTFKKIKGIFVIYRKEDNKILKGINFKEPTIKI